MDVIKRKPRDVIYPVRIPRDVFDRVKQIAERMDLSACQLIRAALREKIRVEEKTG